MFQNGIISYNIQKEQHFPLLSRNEDPLGMIFDQSFGQLVDALRQKLQLPFDPNQKIQGYRNGKAKVAYQVEKFIHVITSP